MRDAPDGTDRDAGRMIRVTHLQDAPVRDAPWPGGSRARVLAGAAPEPASAAGLVEIELEPGARIPEHAHGDAETLVYVVSGRIRMGWEGGVEVIRAGEVAHVPRGLKVAVSGVEPEPARAVAVFSPGGFEQGFLSWQAADDQPSGERDEPRALLDLIGLPRPQRHRTVVAALEALDPGTRLVIVNDHEPVPLRRQLEGHYGERLGWETRELAPHRAVVAIWLDDPEVRRELAVAGACTDPFAARGMEGL